MVILGIDLGTKNICVATPKLHSFGIVLNREAKRTNEGIIGFTECDGRLFGSFARSRLRRNVRNTISEIIRLLGRKWTDKDLRQDSEWWGFKLVKHPHSSQAIAIEVQHNNKVHVLAPEQILAAYISYLRELAISDLKTKDVRDCCVAVPSYFTHEQRQMVINSCKVARMNLLSIVNSTTAAALMYGLNPMDNEVELQYVMFIDIGYANTQVAVAEYETKKKEMHMICHTSDRNAGGRDIDRAMVKYFVTDINKKYSVDLLNCENVNWKVVNRLLLSCDKLKKLLGLNNEASTLIDCLLEGDDYTLSLNREQLQELIEPIIARMVRPIKDALLQVKTKLSAKPEEAKFQCVELIGGGLRVPLIRQRIEEIIELARKEIPRMENCIVRKTMNGDECISKGTAYLATMLSKSYIVRNVDFSDMTNFDIHVVFSAETNKLIPVNDLAIPMVNIINRPIWRRGSKIPSTRILELNAKQAEQLIRTPNSPNNYALISQHDQANLSFGANNWLCKIFIEWEEIANHKYSQIIQEHLRTSEKSPLILLVRISSDELLERFEAYCPISTSILDAFDKSKKEAEEKLKPQENKDSEIADAKQDAKKIETEGQESMDTTSQEMETSEDAEKAIKEDTVKKKINKKTKITLRVKAGFFMRNMVPVKEASELELAMKQLDDEIMNIQNTRNFLETLIYEVRDKLEEQYISVVEPNKLDEHKDMISKMMYKLEDEEELSKDVSTYSTDIEIIKSVTKPLEKLFQEHMSRPKVVAVLSQLINQYVTTAEKAEYMDEEKKKKVTDKCNTIQTWLKEKMTEQEKLPLWSNVAVSVTLIEHKLKELNGFCRPLCKAPPTPVKEKKSVPLKQEEKMETDETADASTKETAGDMDAEATDG